MAIDGWDYKVVRSVFNCDAFKVKILMGKDPLTGQRVPVKAADDDNLFGGYGGYPGTPTVCPHTEATSEEFVALCVPRFGGSFQDLYDYLKRKGYAFVKVAP